MKIRIKRQNYIALFIIASIVLAILDVYILSMYSFDNTPVQSTHWMKGKRRFNPFINRWQMRFNNKQRGYLFFKHMRKAGGTTMKKYLRRVVDYYHNVHSTAGGQTQGIKQEISFIEQEFTAMDWECSHVDPRWNNTLSIIILRHPIERHLSEFFYSGPGSALRLDAKKLFDSNINNKYTKKVQKILRDELPGWLKATGGDRRSMQWFFGRGYTDNYQVRALAGCARGSCLISKNLTREENALLNEGIRFALNSPSTNSNGTCTVFKKTNGMKMDTCTFAPTEGCPYGCDTPCFYPVPAWGRIGNADLSRAIAALNSYDAVFLTESLDNDDQFDFLTDVMGLRHHATFSLKSRRTNIKKRNDREKTHFYRDLLMHLDLDDLHERLQRENHLEIQLYEYAVKLNQQMIKYWKDERRWIG